MGIKKHNITFPSGDTAEVVEKPVYFDLLYGELYRDDITSIIKELYKLKQENKYLRNELNFYKEKVEQYTTKGE